MQNTTAKAHQGRMSYHAGLSAEETVERAYTQAGYSCVAKRWMGQGGEIDLIFKAAETFVFVEVKKARNFAAAAHRISRRQQHRLFAAATEYTTSLPKGNLTDMRLDVALVDGVGAVHIMENALQDG